MKTQRPSHHNVLNSCKNCGEQFQGSYCNTCGQDAHVGKIDQHFVYHEVQHALFHVDKGIIYTIKQLLSRPGHTIREFIAGKRVKHCKPLAFLLVMAGAYAFINHFFKADVIVTGKTGMEVADTSIEQVNEYIKEHFAWFVLLELPLIAWVYFLFFRKYGTNYLEQVVICCYVSGLRTFINIFLLVLSYYWPLTGSILDQVMPLLLFNFTYIQFYQKHKPAAIVVRATIGYLVFYLLILMLLSIILTVLAS